MSYSVSAIINTAFVLQLSYEVWCLVDCSSIRKVFRVQACKNLRSYSILLFFFPSAQKELLIVSISFHYTLVIQSKESETASLATVIDINRNNKFEVELSVNHTILTSIDTRTVLKSKDTAGPLIVMAGDGFFIVVHSGCHGSCKICLQLTFGICKMTRQANALSSLKRDFGRGSNT